MSIINININKNITTHDNRPVEGPKPFMDNVYSAKLLKNVTIAGVKFAICKNYILNEFDYYSVEHHVGDDRWKEDFTSKNINECVEFLKELNNIVSSTVESLIASFPKDRKNLKKYHEMKKRAYPNE